ncbi:MAG: hypothetical protein JNL57_04420, partial [Bacteroidetes bacterium]|nr:hypothetical protein [Bacteroidota bacterium]
MVLGLILTGIGVATLGKHKAGGHDSHAKTEQAAKSHEAAAPAHGEKAGHDAVAHAGTEGHAAVEHSNTDNPNFGPRIEYHPQDKPASTRIYTALLTIGYFLLLISLAALFFIAVQYIANAGWSAVIKRVPEAMSTFIPVAFILTFVVILLGKNDLYHWVHYEHLGLKKGDAGFDAILSGKSWFLNSNMLLIFPTVLVIIWVLIGMKLRKM